MITWLMKTTTMMRSAIVVMYSRSPTSMDAEPSGSALESCWPYSSLISCAKPRATPACTQRRRRWEER